MEFDPGDCTEIYRDGWTKADKWAKSGGNLKADPPENWSDERANGWADRLYRERVATGIQRPAL